MHYRVVGLDYRPIDDRPRHTDATAILDIRILDIRYGTPHFK